MKAIILAAGLGTRLGELTKDTPKCLLKLDENNLLDYQLERLRQAGITETIAVIGKNGSCWTEENKKKIKEKVSMVVTNPENDKTGNAYSLRMAINRLEPDDLIILDGDSFFNLEIIREAVKNPESLVLAKEKNTWEEVASKNKIFFDENKRVLGVGKYLEKEKLSPPYKIYATLMKIKKEHFNSLKEIINDKKYEELSLAFFMDEFCKKNLLNVLVDNHVFNINTKEDLEEAKKMLDRKFVAIMFGYTATGKSTLANAISKRLGTEIFHSAVVRKELNLTPKNLEEADKIFDYRNKLREEMDRKVYGKLAEYAENALKSGKNVILDAGFFFEWQRELVYKKAKENDAELFVIKARCDDENEIKRRIDERARQFGSDPLHETPSWKAYISSKMITEPVEKDNFPGIMINVIEYNYLKGQLEFSGQSSNNSVKIAESIWQIC